ncbi:DEAD/DEAH box helicase family protein [Curtobacterium sp. MCBD17_040]|uniref:DEAD/DEAH box helicase family protein n=1 Tax=Curtobacterium sp. MCBD17_040 TaxID=2175674 RepID=UPI000DAA19E0|nr:DEAD/DEAH box helicase family protein [Curtobacterium sp. MCBD17_040]WIB65616.1 DEAD/DEAH box helicase family protein [Curtobacterium sp. MCBD17_040]
MNDGTTLERLLASIPRDPGDHSQYGSDFELVSDFALRNAVGYRDEVARVEPYGEWAARTGHPVKDLGVDRIVTTHTGDLWAVQNKGYAAGRAVTMTDYATFVTKSNTIPGVTKRILITSGSGLGANARSVHRGSGATPVVVHNRDWLERAAVYPTEWSELRSGGGAGIRGTAMPLRPHQVAAVHDIVRGLRRSPEVQYLSACGTGKTVTSTGVADALHADRVVYFVPTLTLMSQTIDAVRRQHDGRPLTIVAVCSDDSVDVGRGRRRRAADDTVHTTEEDLACEVVHSAAELSAFLARPSVGRLIVFSTYKSAYITIAAQHHHHVPEFDLAFCDEAHHLVGATSKGSTTGEQVKRKDDGTERLLARWRVYATATPRRATADAQVKAQKRGVTLESQGETNATFGPVAHSFTFGHAIEAGILTDYQVSVIATNDSEYAEYVEERTFVENTADFYLDASMFAALQALKRAVAAGDRRILTYHSSIADAEKFAALVDADPDLPGAATVDGTMRSSERTARLARLDQDGGYVIANCQCLAEGVDLPDLDAILIADPKSSAVEIAQCVGRVLRKGASKERGHILIPVAIAVENWDAGVLTDAEAKRLRTKNGPFRPVFEVLAALSEHDEILCQWLTAMTLGLGRRPNRTTLPGQEHSDEEALAGIIGADAAADLLDDGDAAEGLPGLGPRRIIMDKVVLASTGMSEEVVRQFAASMRLGSLTKSQIRGRTTRERSILVVMKAQNCTLEEATARYDAAVARRRSLVGDA